MCIEIQEYSVDNHWNHLNSPERWNTCQQEGRGGGGDVSRCITLLFSTQPRYRTIKNTRVTLSHDVVYYYYNTRLFKQSSRSPRAFRRMYVGTQQSRSKVGEALDQGDEKGQRLSRCLPPTPSASQCSFTLFLTNTILSGHLFSTQSRASFIHENKLTDVLLRR